MITLTYTHTHTYKETLIQTQNVWILIPFLSHCNCCYTQSEWERDFLSLITFQNLTASVVTRSRGENWQGGIRTGHVIMKWILCSKSDFFLTLVLRSKSIQLPMLRLYLMFMIIITYQDSKRKSQTKAFDLWKFSHI